MELTFSIIKPDAVKRNLVPEIQEIFENNGLKIAKQKRILITEDLAKHFYAEHKEKPFFNAMIKNICAGEAVVQILKGENAVMFNRKIMGATNPADAAEGTIRNLYGIDIDFNSVHGSDSKESAERELKIFFTQDEIEEAAR